MKNPRLLIHVGDIVAAHVASNVVAVQDVPQLIKTVYDSLTGLGTTNPTIVTEQAPTPAMTIRASVKPDSVGCLECGKRFKSIKRHLAMHGLTPDQYRAKWSLPASYSMVSAEYGALRAGLAKANGLGRSKSRS
ncbi:transcriptional regulator [Sphingomonas glacialis]|uniref:Transcriptional regulator n=1 Tax=Sphingomonas glacialis TaxID=658225 RepID=A0ABQ3LN39_9SPHN|nr:MucR family transcriptional regulator [Sphingomonas glacialis]GHH20970.1 transcriptional regulator [Sphingomonas glacialis]